MPLTAQNILTITVDVITAGTYYICSNMDGQIYFVGSGTFTGTGLTQVTLTGGGTPVTQGWFGGSTQTIDGMPGCLFSLNIN